MKTTSYLRGNAYGSAVLALALMFALVWLLSGCMRTDSGDAAGERYTTTTTQYVPPTTQYVPTTTMPSVSREDRAYEALISKIPVLGGNTRADVEDMLGTVCDVIDEQDGDFATVGDIIVASSEDSFAFSYGEAGTIVATAIIIRCPEWADAAYEFANS